MGQIEYRAAIATLLDDSPITSEKVIRNVRELLAVGEEGIALDTLCSWIYEDSLPITRSYYERLAAIASEMEIDESVSRLDELIVEKS